MLSESTEDFSDTSDTSWITWFCELEGHEFFAEVAESFIQDEFNLYGLRSRFPNYRDAISMVLSPSCPDEDELSDPAFLEVYKSASELYGLIHARYIQSPQGLAVMREYFLSGRFGNCPRVLCERQAVLPAGQSEELHHNRVKLFCPRCEDMYVPKHKFSDVDGAYFGTSFPHFLLAAYPDLIPDKEPKKYVPKIFGFKVRRSNLK
mmetsp:Transcript_24016/g.42632  ORF Transcript_24016/g.42632 Transcript_24016/m.42632 type:complete len:206 (+) Transcript_24016:2011-2628(+)